jgi:haloalkane dehalogenase
MTNALAISSPAAPAWLSRQEYPFGSHHLQLPEGALHYVDEGEGEVLVFVHGTPTWSFEYRQLIKQLRGSYRCLALDHLGFGLSERPRDADYRPEAHAARFAAWLEQLGIERCTLVVHDFGGAIALPWAEAHPERVARVVLLNTWLWSFEGDPAMERGARLAGSWLGRFLYRYFNASLRLLMPAAYGDRSRLTPAIHAQYLALFRDGDSRVRVLHALAQGLWQSRAHFAALWSARERLARVPLQIIWGLADKALPPAVLTRLREGFPGAEVVALEGVGHWPHEEAPERVLAALSGFLQREQAVTRAPAPPGPASDRACA